MKEMSGLADPGRLDGLAAARSAEFASGQIFYRKTTLSLILHKERPAAGS
ncbi:hypothetical protein [Neorhizobium galegae]|nr:hypothetical protein [Neorhizobium galegae]